MAKMTEKTQKRLIVSTLSVACVVLVGILAAFTLGEKEAPPLPVPIESNTPAVSVDEIKADSPEVPVVSVPEIDEQMPSITDPEKPNDILLTPIPAKPEAPAKPETAAPAEKDHPIPTDPVLTNPEKKPDTVTPPVEPDKPKEDAPQGGETNNKGQTYVPGFGWIEDSGPNVESKSDSDGDWDKQIGTMD